MRSRVDGPGGRAGAHEVEGNVRVDGQNDAQGVVHRLVALRKTVRVSAEASRRPFAL